MAYNCFNHVTLCTRYLDKNHEPHHRSAAEATESKSSLYKDFANNNVSIEGHRTPGYSCCIKLNIISSYKVVTEYD